MGIYLLVLCLISEVAFALDCSSDFQCQSYYNHNCYSCLVGTGKCYKIESCCEINMDCQDGFYCASDFICRKNINTCNSNSSCVKGYYCLNNVCSEITKPCSSDADCSGAYYCKLADLVCSKGCDVKADCNVGYNCYQGECEKERQISNYSVYLFVVIGIPIIVVAVIAIGIILGIRNNNKSKTAPQKNGMEQSQNPRVPTPNNGPAMGRSNPDPKLANLTDPKLAQTQILPP